MYFGVVALVVSGGKYVGGGAGGSAFTLIAGVGLFKEKIF